MFIHAEVEEPWFWISCSMCVSSALSFCSISFYFHTLPAVHILSLPESNFPVLYVPLVIELLSQQKRYYKELSIIDKKP